MMMMMMIFNYGFPSLEGEYNEEESSFHLIEVLYQILKYPNIYYYCISTTPFSALKQKKNLVRLQSQLFDVLLCHVQILSYVYCYCI